jgi:hypothetical protein
MEFLLSHIQLIRSLANVDPKKRRKNSEIDNFSQLYFKQLFSADRLWSFQGIHKIRILNIENWSSGELSKIGPRSRTTR